MFGHYNIFHFYYEYCVKNLEENGKRLSVLGARAVVKGFKFMSTMLRGLRDFSGNNPQKQNKYAFLIKGKYEVYMQFQLRVLVIKYVN